MKNLLLISSVFLFAILSIMSCEDDVKEDSKIEETEILDTTLIIKVDSVDVDKDSLQLEILNPQIITIEKPASEVKHKNDFSFSVYIKKGSLNLRQLIISENEIIMSENRVRIDKINGINSYGGYDLTKSDTLVITLNANEVGGLYRYEICVEDSAKNLTCVEFNVQIIDLSEKKSIELYSILSQSIQAPSIGSFYNVTDNESYTSTFALRKLEYLDFALSESELGGDTFYFVRPQDQFRGNIAITSSSSAKTIFSLIDFNYDIANQIRLKNVAASANSVQVVNGGTYYFYNSNTRIMGVMKVNSVDYLNRKINFSLKYFTETGI